MRLALAAVALVLALSACAGVESQPDLWVESQPNFRQAALRTGSLPSYAYEVRIDEFNLGERRERVCSGAVDNVRPAARQACEGGWHELAEIRRIETTSYEAVVGTDKWIRAPGADLIAGYSTTSPTSILELVELAGETRRLDEEVVRGEPTVRYQVTTDCERTDDLCVEQVFEAWIDGDGLVRRLDTFYDGPVDTRRVDFFDFGVPVDVQEPSPELIQEPHSPVPVPCGSRSAGPIGVPDAIDAFRRHGFDVVRDPFGWQCTDSAVDYVGWPARAETDTPPRSGNVLCVVYAEGPLGKIRRPLPHIPYQAEHTVENLSCGLTARGGRIVPRELERVAVFEDALKQLKREHGS